jgi:ankyrin repeat protein
MEAMENWGLHEFVQYVNQGASLNCRDEYGQTVLHYSLPPDILRYVLARREIDLNTRDNDGNAPLHAALDVEKARALIRAGANPLLRNNAGQTPREYMAQFDHSDDPDYEDLVIFLQGAEDAYRQGTMDDFIRNM